MLHASAPLPEVAQVLRHRSTATTSIYAKVDHLALRELAMPWPGDLASALADYLVTCRAFGYKLDLHSQGFASSSPTSSRSVPSASQSTKPSAGPHSDRTRPPCGGYASSELSVLFARYLVALDSATEVGPASLLLEPSHPSCRTSTPRRISPRLSRRRDS
jgi:hypothetical protein